MRQEPICTGCNKRPSELAEYVEAAAQYDRRVTPADYVRIEEGTYNPLNGHFLCTPCYIAAGQPSNPWPGPGWRAP